MKSAIDEQEKDKRHPVCVAVGKSLKTLRIAQKMSQAELAFLADVDRTFVSHIERGMTNPSILSLDTLCYALGISLSVLFEPVNQAFPPASKGGDGIKKVKPITTSPMRRLR